MNIMRNRSVFACSNTVKKDGCVIMFGPRQSLSTEIATCHMITIISCDVSIVITMKEKRSSEEYDISSLR